MKTSNRYSFIREDVLSECFSSSHLGDTVITYKDRNGSTHHIPFLERVNYLSGQYDRKVRRVTMWRNQARAAFKAGKDKVEYIDPDKPDGYRYKTASKYSDEICSLPEDPEKAAESLGLRAGYAANDIGLRLLRLNSVMHQYVGKWFIPSLLTDSQRKYNSVIRSLRRVSDPKEAVDTLDEFLDSEDAEDAELACWVYQLMENIENAGIDEYQLELVEFEPDEAKVRVIVDEFFSFFDEWENSGNETMI